MKVLNLYPKPHAGQPTREIAVSSSAIAFTGDAATLQIGTTNFITYTSVAKNDSANNITVAYNQSLTTVTSAAVSGQAITVAVGYQALTASLLSTNLTGANNDLTFTAVTAGVAGDNITIEYIDPSANDEPLAISVTGDAIEVTLATDGGGVITSTASQIKTAIEADAGAAALVSVALKTGNTGAGIVTALAATNLAGGYDAALVGTLDDIETAVDAVASALVTTAVTGTGSTVAALVAAQNLSGGAEAFDLESSYVLLNVKANSVYATFDGTTPSSTNGVILPSGYLENWSSHAARAAKFIQNSGAARVVGVPLTD